MLKLILKPTLIQILNTTNLNTTVRFIKPALAVVRFGKTTDLLHDDGQILIKTIDVKTIIS